MHTPLDAVFVQFVMICGIERPSAGKIWFSGHDITRLKNREVTFLRRQIGMIFQDHHLQMDRTVYDNVAIPLIIAGASGHDIRRRVSTAVCRVEPRWGFRIDGNARHQPDLAAFLSNAHPERWSLAWRRGP